MDVDRLKASTYVMTSTVESSPDVCLAISFNRLWGSVKFLIYKLNKNWSVSAADGTVLLILAAPLTMSYRLNCAFQRKERKNIFTCFLAAPETLNELLLKQTLFRKQLLKLSHTFFFVITDRWKKGAIFVLCSFAPTGGSVITSTFTFLSRRWWWW